MEIKIKNCKFSVDAKEIMVTCTLKGTKNIFKDFARSNIPEIFNKEDYNNDEYAMSESFSCRAWLKKDCKESKIQKQAFHGMRFKLVKQFHKRMNKFFENKGLDDKEQTRILELSMLYLK